MKKLLTLATAILLISCNDYDGNMLSTMKSPVILIGKSKNISASDVIAVTVKDADGKICSFYGSAFAQSMYFRKIGDTLK